VTLKNARRRFAEMGYEAERDVAPYKYKARKVGTTAWRRASCLEWLLEYARTESANEKGR
jgi:hypothetical protein